MESNEVCVCPLCRHEKVKIFAVGECLHPVCHLCSTKMRVLCEQTYCAICRKELSKVYFVSDLSTIQPTIDQSRFIPIDETGDCGIYYPIKAEWIRRETEKLLRNFCPFCYSEYETFEILSDHVRRIHRYFYCVLCVEHLDLFPHERKCYTRHDLVQHIKFGDRDDSSFKGHPLCEFCDDHFLDVDQLYKHMRKEHYYCHLCSNDSVYYSDFGLLRDHYRSSHYLCDIGQCKDVQFTNVFASEIDFRAHQAAQHSKNRAEARQLGTIPVEFQLTSIRNRQQNEPAHRGTFKSGEFKTQETNNSSKNERDDIRQEPAVPVAVPSIDEFPTLGERSSTSQHVLQQRSVWVTDAFRRIHSSDDFPTLANTANNASNTNANQPRGIWREQQVTSSSTASAITTTKKGPQQGKPSTDGVTSINVTEDFPALMTASHSKISAPVSMFSAWSTAKKSAKSSKASTKVNQPPMRMNANRLINDDEDDECIRRPMSSLTTSTVPVASSNITLISSSNLPNSHTNESQDKHKRQSLPNANDFPALPSTSTKTQKNLAHSNTWVTNKNNESTKSSSNQQKKKNSNANKKKFLEEMQTMTKPPSLTSSDDFPHIGLSQLGQRLITEEDQQAVVVVEKKEEKPSTPSPASSQMQKETENKSTHQSNKKKSNVAKTKEPINKQEIAPIKDETPAKSVADKGLEKSLVKDDMISQAKPSIEVLPNYSTAVVVSPPPGFTTPLVVPPPPGFNTTPVSQETAHSYISTSTYSNRKDEFRAKILNLFDCDMALFIEYDQFCEAFSQNKISSQDFLTYTMQLFKDKFDEYLLDLIVIMPNIKQQNELYENWKKGTSSTLVQTEKNTKTWKKNDSNEKNIHICHICRQIMFELDIEEHNANHTEFNTQFPSLPAAAVSIGQRRRKIK